MLKGDDLRFATLELSAAAIETPLEMLGVRKKMPAVDPVVNVYSGRGSGVDIGWLERHSLKMTVRHWDRCKRCPGVET